MERPSATSPDFPAYLSDMVTKSKGLREAADKMGYRSTTVVRYHMKKLGIKSPPEWARRPHLGLVAQGKIPVTVISTLEGRSWVAALIQGEGCIQSIYRKNEGLTYLELDTSMVDPMPIFRLSEYFGLPKPSKPVKNHEWKPLWRKSVSGLRALRVLQEILPFLVGEKRREAEKAVVFFAPRGFHQGEFCNQDIWSHREFPLRSKGGSE